jgi:hypothetical protein
MSNWMPVSMPLATPTRCNSVSMVSVARKAILTGATLAIGAAGSYAISRNAIEIEQAVACDHGKNCIRPSEEYPWMPQLDLVGGQFSTASNSVMMVDMSKVATASS